MEFIKEYINVLDVVIGVLLVPLVKFILDMRLKIERFETIINIMLKELEDVKRWLREFNNDEEN